MADPKERTTSGLMKAAEIGLSTYASVTAAKIIASPAARAAAGMLTKAFVPLTVGLAVKDGVQGYQENGFAGAAQGVADSLTGGGFSFAVDAVTRMANGGRDPTPAAPAPAPNLVSDRLDIARQAATRTAGEMGRSDTMNQGSSRTAAAETSSDGMTEEYFRTQNGRQVRVSGYSTPSR